MAAYLLQADFLDQTIPGDAFTGLNPSTIDKALLWASRKADSYLIKRYAVPLQTPVSEDLQSIVGDLAAWALSKRRGFRPGHGDNEAIRLAYEDAIKWLEEVRDGHQEIAGAVDLTPDVDEMGSLVASDPANNWSITTSQPDPFDLNDEDGDDDGSMG